MIKNILTSRKVIYAFQVLVFAWIFASTIYISLNMFVWLLNGIFLGVFLYSYHKNSHHKRNDILAERNWAKMHLLVTKSLTLLNMVMKSYSRVSKISENTLLSDTERDELNAIEKKLIDHATKEVAEIKTEVALMDRGNGINVKNN